IILAAILSRKGSLWWPMALLACFLGVLLGDFVVYFLGYFYGEKVLSFRLTRKFLTRAREAQIKGYFHRHGIKIMMLGRLAVGSAGPGWGRRAGPARRPACVGHHPTARARGRPGCGPRGTTRLACSSPGRRRAGTDRQHQVAAIGREHTQSNNINILYLRAF